MSRFHFPALILALACALPATSRGGDEARIARVFHEAAPSVVAVHYTLRLQQAEEGGQGNKVEGVLCGVLAGPNGLIVTSADVFPEPGGDPRQTFVPSRFVIRLDGREHEARAVGLDRLRNLAFLQAADADALGAGPVRFVRRSPREGEPVLLLGLMGEIHDYAPTFTEARIVGRLPGEGPRFGLDALVQDLTIGGLVISLKGEALGIVGEDTLEARPSGISDLAAAGNVLSLFSSMSQGQRPGYPVMLPYDGLLDALLDTPPPLGEDALPNRGWLGIIMQPLDRDLADYWQVPGPGGVVIGSVLDGSPAEEAGLQVGDIILEVDHAQVQVREARDLVRFREMVQLAGVGREVPLAIFRDGERREVPLVLGARPKNVFLAEEVRDRRFGFTVKELTFDFLQATNSPEDSEGVFVADVENAGWADIGGLQVNDMITALQGEPVAGLDSFKAALAKVDAERPDHVVFFVRRGARTRFVPIKPEW